MARISGRSGRTDSRFMVFAPTVCCGKSNFDSVLERLCKLPDEAPPVPFVTGAWGDGVVVFSIGPGGSYRVPATGGDVQKLTSTRCGATGELSQLAATAPRRTAAAFVRTEDTSTTGSTRRRLDAPAISQVIATSSRAVYASGSLLWTIDDRLVAQPFDPSRFGCPANPSPWCRPSFRERGRTSSFWASAATGPRLRERRKRGTAVQVVQPNRRTAGGFGRARRLRVFRAFSRWLAKS